MNLERGRLPIMLRPAMILAVLVVLPTAVLSLLAGRLLRERETVLQARFEAGASRAIHDVAALLTTAIENDWRAARTAVAGALAPRGRPSDIDALLPDLSTIAPLAGSLLVFMDPLGFVYPDEPATETADLVQAWRQELALPSGLFNATQPRLLFFDGNLYCFGPLGHGPGMYVGFRISDRAFRRRLAAILEDVAGDDLVLAVRLEVDPGPPVLISDPFSPLPLRLSPGQAVQDPAADMLFTATLPAPFTFLTLSVAWRDPGQMSRAAVWRLRLFRWGVALLVVCVMVGGWLILHQTAMEIRRLRERNTLMMSMSHDLRTPIAAMRMMAESLYLDHVRDPADRREFLRTLISETDRLSDMSERVLFFVRQERRAVVHAMESVDAGQLAKDAVNVYRERATLGTAAASKIDLWIARGLPPVHGDWRALEAVLMNLIDNALIHGAVQDDPSVRAYPGIRVMVDAAMRRGRVEVRLAVRDFGTGIAYRERGRIFRRFYRGVAAKGSGSGLGLALCRDIVRAHGGRITVWSEIGRGSEFRVWLRAEDKEPV